MSEYTKSFENPYPNGWENSPSVATPITAEALQKHTNAIVNLENYLSENPLNWENTDNKPFTSIGDNLTVDEEGRLNAEKGGSDVQWNQIQTEGTKIAEVTIEGETTEVFAPVGGGGGSVLRDLYADIEQEGVILPLDGWVDNMQTIVFEGVTSDSMVFIDYMLHNDIYCEQGVNELTFIADKLPEEDVEIKIGVINALIDEPDYYSTEEQIIGRWIDGRPIYNQVISCDFQTGTNPSDWVFGPTIQDADILINCICFQSNMTASWQYTQRGMVDGRLQFTFNLPVNRPIGVIIAEYTKTTDTPVPAGSDISQIATDDDVADVLNSL